MAVKQFYNSDQRLQYHPSTQNKRSGIKRLVAFDDRFEEVARELTAIILAKKSSPVKVLDVGCGDAVYESLLESNDLAKCQIYGIDISTKQLNRAKKYLHQGNVVDLDKQKLPYQDNFFDIVLISEVLEHLFFPEKVMTEIARVTKKGGNILMTYPNSGALQLRLSLLLAGSSPLLNYRHNKEHIRFYNQQDIKELLGSKLVIEKKKGLGSLVFADWNFLAKIPMPRVLEIIFNNYLPNLALGTLNIVRKI